MITPTQPRSSNRSMNPLCAFEAFHPTSEYTAYVLVAQNPPNPNPSRRLLSDKVSTVVQKGILPEKLASLLSTARTAGRFDATYIPPIPRRTKAMVAAGISLFQ